MAKPTEDGTDVRIQVLLDRCHSGDASAKNELLQHSAERLYRLTRKMLRSFPKLRRWIEDEDVLQNAMLRLHRALQDVDVQSARHFLNLATLQIRRELHDLAKHFYGPHGIAANHQTGRGPPDEKGGLIHSISAQASDGKGWVRFHEAVEKMPEGDQEVVNLVFYEGLTFEECARVLGCSSRTVKRRWAEIKVALRTEAQREDN